MIDELLAVSSRVATTQLALESLRVNDTARALELLELDLEASILRLASLASKSSTDERKRVTELLETIRDYRRAHPRRTEADLGDLASGLLVRSGDLSRQRVQEILEHIDKNVA